MPLACGIRPQALFLCRIKFDLESGKGQSGRHSHQYLPGMFFFSSSTVSYFLRALMILLLGFM